MRLRRQDEEFLESGSDPDLGRPVPFLPGWPARQRWQRPAVFVLVLGLCLGATVAEGIATYRRDVAADRDASLLVLGETATGDPVILPDTMSLDREGVWSSKPSTTVEVDVTNRGPDSVTLLPGAPLRGPGVVAGALAPEGGAKLKPGQVGRLVGTVTVDCVATQERGRTTVAVRARLANGSVSSAPIGLDVYGESVREQICLEQGAGVVPGDFPQSVDPASHTFTIAMSAHSLSPQPIRYQLAYQYSSSGGSAVGDQGAYAGILGTPVPTGTTSGLLEPGGDLSGGFVVPVTLCPVGPSRDTVDVELRLIGDDGGRPVLLRAAAFDLSTLVAAACG